VPREYLQKPYWKNEYEWVCPRHLPSLVNKSTDGVCAFSGCYATRPRRVLAVKLCSHEKCNTLYGSKGNQRPKSKYCGDDCRKKQARLNYRKRNA